RYSNQNVGLVIRNDKIEVYDQNGVVRVRIGRL
ncbi:phage tail protein, partial [Escherichia coli]|nr:phage tail protein [Escherichia coli]